MGKKDKPAKKPETKEQRESRRDSTYECPDCGASFSDPVQLGLHVVSAHEGPDF